MKRILIFVFIALPLSMMAQNNYQSMLIDGRSWEYTQYVPDWENMTEENRHSPEAYFKSDHSLKVMGDSVIDGKACKKIYYESAEEKSVFALAYEEDKKVYIRFLKEDLMGEPIFEEKDGWVQLYDFGAAIGSETFLPTMHDCCTLVEVEQIWVKNAKYRRQIWKYANRSNDARFFHVEGIGCHRGLFLIDSTVNNGSWIEYKGCFQNGECIFSGDDFNIQAPSDYRPFLKEGKVWNCQITERTTERIGEATASYLQTTVFGLRIDGDIVFDGKTYKRFYRDTISVERKLIDADPESAAESLPQYEYREGGGTALNEEFLREEGRKIFIYWPPRGTELLLYDFSLAEGESTSGNYVGGSDLSVDKIETIVAQGQEFRRFVLSSPDRKNLFWIEGVGHPCGPFRAYGNEVSDGREYTLLSVYEDGECVFSKDDFNAIAQTDYYYYQGKKIPLTLNENKVCVSISKDCNEIIERFRANVHVLTTIKDETFGIFVISQSDFEKLTAQDFWEEDAKSVILTSSYFTENNKEVFETPYLNVRLKKEDDKDLLTSYAEKYKLKIVSHSSLMPAWYTLAVTPDSEKNTLKCANALFESGNFASSVPDLCELSDEINLVDVVNVTNNSQEIYDLQGRRLKTAPEKGVYIRGGKKFVRK